LFECGFHHQGSPHKARNILKRMSKIPFQDQWANEHIYGYLLLAKFQVGKAKFDLGFFSFYESGFVVSFVETE